jgi:hypothetical protein
MGCEDDELYPANSIPQEFWGRYFNDMDDFDYPKIVTVTAEGIIWSGVGEPDRFVQGVYFYHKVLKGPYTSPGIIMCTKREDYSNDCERQLLLRFEISCRLLLITAIDKYGNHEFTQAFHPIRCL